MFGTLGFPELLMIFVVALLLFGPRKMPEIGKSIGRALGELRRASNDFKRTIEEEVATEEIREVQRELQSTVTESRQALSGVSGASGKQQSAGAEPVPVTEDPNGNLDDGKPGRAEGSSAESR